MRICPFVSHMLGDDQSNLLTIGEAAERSGSHGNGDKSRSNDVVVLGYDEASDSEPKQASATKTSPMASHLYCLRESCRFYHGDSGDCQFDLMHAALNDSSGATPDVDRLTKDISNALAKDIDKIWTFQTKSVTELVETMSESERRQEQAIEGVRGDFERTMKAIQESAVDPDGLPEKMDALKKRFDEREEGIEDLATTMSDVVINLNESINELRKKSDGIAQQIDGLNESADEKAIRHMVEKSLDERLQSLTPAGFAKPLTELGDRIESFVKSAHQGNPRLEAQLEAAAGMQQDMESRMRGWQKEILGTLTEIARRQEEWKTRMDVMAEQYDKLSGYLEEGRKQQEREQVRTGKKEARKFNNLGVTSFHNGAFEMARDQFLQAVKVDPDFAEAYNNLGLAYTELNQEDKASDAFRRAIEMNPALHAAYNNLGYIFYRQGQYDQAIEMYNEALGRSTNNSSAYTNLGNAYYKLGKMDEAQRAWSRALELDPANDKAKRNLERLREEIS